ncbi:MAG: primosomal protein N' (replication factor Y) [Patiriisocius sp.]
MFYIDVILPIPLKQTFTYSVNKDEAAFLKEGHRVAVPFGKSKVYTAIVYQVHTQAPQGYETKSIDQILDETPIITSFQIKHWEWMAGYYMCTLGEIIKAALPSAFLLESETIVSLRADAQFDEAEISDAEFLVLEALQQRSPLHINDVRAILDSRQVVKVLKDLLDKHLIEVQEEVYEQYAPKLKKYIKIAPAYQEEELLAALLDSLKRAPKQKEILIHLFSLQAQTKKAVGVASLQNACGAGAGSIKSLVSKGVLEEFYLKKDRVEYDGDAGEAIMQLSDAQEKACQEIKTSFNQQDVVLLHGVTASGKTEIYITLIEEQLTSGKQVLFMLPEIALTTQLITRLQFYFGEKISVYHSKYSVNERVEVWNNVLQKKAKAQIIIGARSSIFLPFSNLGLIVVDESHEPSFKQYNPAPRYHARDSAVVLANIHQGKLLMGSATPSLESYHNAKEGKYGLVELKTRFGNIQMPRIELVDIKEKHKKKKMTGHFSDRLLEEIQESLKNEEQIILFQNRRGFSPIVECKTCGTSPQCSNCDVSLTYHKYKNQLRCHYCGYNTPMQISCKACGLETLDNKGFGTEQIETELLELFPNHTVARMDQDTTKGKHAYKKLIDRLENLEIDILVGTQMLAKGLDFRNIGLVGVMNADNLLNFPDFRAHERSFQLLLQVAGRAGRTNKRGRVLIQTYNPYHTILQQVSINAYQEMYTLQKEERYQFKYPPFFRTIKIIFKDRNLQKVEKGASWYAMALKQHLQDNILGPEAPAVARVRNQYITAVLVKISKKNSLQKTKEYIASVQRSFNSVKEFGSIRVTIDVDNY